MKRQFAFVACLAALFAWAPAQAQELKFATQNPKGHPLAMGMEKFAEIVAAKSGGRLKVKLFPGGGLGGDQAHVSALQGGTLGMGGQETPPTVISANRLYEVQKHIVLSHHQYNPQSLIFSKKIWDTLGSAEKKILSDAAVEAAKYQRQVSRDAAGTALENLKKNGMQVTELSAAELAKFREAMKPVIAKQSEIVGAENVTALQADLAKIRK